MKIGAYTFTQEAGAHLRIEHGLNACIIPEDVLLRYVATRVLDDQLKRVPFASTTDVLRMLGWVGR